MVERDPEYEWVPPTQGQSGMPTGGRGRQCGECGMKFDNNKAYGFCCSNMRCPMGWGPLTRNAIIGKTGH
jgi:hypothetical protein